MHEAVRRIESVLLSTATDSPTFTWSLTLIVINNQ